MRRTIMGTLVRLALCVIALAPVATLGAPKPRPKPKATPRTRPAPKRQAAPKTESAQKPKETGRINLSLTEKPLSEALGLLGDEASDSFVLDCDVPNPKLTLEIKDAQFEDALSQMVRQAEAKNPGIRFNKERGVYRIAVKRSASPDLAGGDEEPDDATPLEKRMTVNLRGTPLRSALWLLFHEKNVKYDVDPSVDDFPLTMTLRDVSLDQILRYIVSAARTVKPNFSIIGNKDVYEIKGGGKSPVTPS
jgi:hypothetical protein